MRYYLDILLIFSFSYLSEWKLQWNIIEMKCLIFDNWRIHSILLPIGSKIIFIFRMNDMSDGVINIIQKDESIKSVPIKKTTLGFL